MTLEELKADPREFVNAHDIAPIIGCGDYLLVLTAREAPDTLGFPCTVMGKRVRFPKRAFIKFIEGGREEQT